MRAFSSPLALYIHVPFCRQRCSYCHFDIKVFHPGTQPEPFFRAYLDCVRTELAHYGRLYGSRHLASVFYGGGTPSRLGAHHLATLHGLVCSQFSLEEDAEISVEVNPEDGERDLLKALLAMGVNRVSFGVQTFDPAGLKAINRPHTAERALAVIAAAPAFTKGTSLDLILGLPFQTASSLNTDLELIAQLAPQHLALYLLERDLPTPLDKTARGLPIPDEDQQADFYEFVAEFLTQRGYRHYEISNFALPGFDCRHNLNYWRQGDYLGIGPAAHGRIGNRYFQNWPHLNAYRKAVEAQGHGQKQTETWSPGRLKAERLIQGLRLSQGVPLSEVSTELLPALEAHRQNGLVLLDDERLRLSLKGRLLANEVFQLFLEEA